MDEQYIVIETLAIGRVIDWCREADSITLRFADGSSGNYLFSEVESV